MRRPRAALGRSAPRAYDAAMSAKDLLEARARAPGAIVRTRLGEVHALVEGSGPPVVLVHGVTESAVIGCPHPDFGEAVVAVVLGKGDEAEMISAARAHLAAFKAPKRIFFVEDLPRNAMGKVQKNLLRDAYAHTFS